MARPSWFSNRRRSIFRIPQFVVYSDLPHTKGKIVACTQPRRVAAMSVAKRVAGWCVQFSAIAHSFMLYNFT